MARKRKLRTADGREVDATVLTFRTNSENFNEYLLDDNTVIKLKVVVTEVMRLEGEYDSMGNPSYFVQSTNVVSVDASDNMRREG